MVYRITDKCIMCGSCEPFCPKGGITEGDTTYVIDEAQCNGCGTCAEYCPIDGALVPVPVPAGEA